MATGPAARLKASKRRIGWGELRLQTETLRQGGWLLIATIVTGIFNYLSNILVGRMLGPADYSIFASLLSLVLILGVLAGVVQTVTSNYVARLRARGAMSETGAFLVYLALRLLPLGIGSTLLLAVISQPLSTFLRMPSPVPIITLSLVVIPVMLLPVVYGALAGVQRFGALGATQIGGGVLRLIAVVTLISLGLGVAGAVASLLVSYLGALVLGVLYLRELVRHRGEERVVQPIGLFEYSLHTVLALLAFAMLTNSDLIIVKSRFSPDEAGLYAAAAALGKVTLWLPAAVGVLLLPKATEQHARMQSSASLVWKSLLATGLLCGGFIIVFFLFPTPLVRVLFGELYVAHASLLGLYALAMMLFSLVNVCLYYYLAVQEKRYGYFLLAGAALLVLLLMTLPLTMAVVIELMIGIGACLSLVGVWGILRWDPAMREPKEVCHENSDL